MTRHGGTKMAQIGKRDTFRSTWGGKSVFSCTICGRATRHTNSGNGDCELCPECYEASGDENTLSDDAVYFAANPAEKARMEARVRALKEKAASKGGDRLRLGLV
jgi:hypothetical protein